MPANDFDRPRGILSEADRQWLAAQNPTNSEFDPNTYHRKDDYKRREAITERLINAYIDTEQLVTSLPQSLRKKIFETLNEQSRDLSTRASAPIALTYLGLTDLTTDPDYYHNLRPPTIANTSLLFRNTVCNALKTGKDRHPHTNNPPETVLVDANTRLQEFPEITASDLPQDLYARYGKGRYDVDGTKLTATGDFPPSVAIDYLYTETQAWIREKLYNRRQNADTTLNRYDTEPSYDPWF